MNSTTNKSAFGPQDMLDALEKLYALQPLSFVEAQAVF
ncbi:MAG: anthranilate phosphoribosyltransferase, partial [Glaciecola sp.]